MTKIDNRTEIQDYIVDSLPENCHGLLTLAPRVGKSRIALRVVKNEQPESILWVTPTTDLRDDAIPKEYDVWDTSEYLEKSTIICYGSLSGITGHFDKIILDEYQYITEANSLPLFNGQITYGSIIGLSGTHPRNMVKGDIYRRLGLHPIAEIGIDEAVDKGLLADYTIKVLGVDMNAKDKTIEAGNKKKRFFVTEKKQYEYLDGVANEAIWGGAGGKFPKIMRRMRFVYNSPSKEKAAQWLIDHLPGRKLIFCGSIAQADRLSPYRHHSKMKDDAHLKAFINEEIDILTCVNAGGVGTTYRNVDHFIIIQSTSDNNGDTTQKLTRSLLKQEDYKADIWFLRLNGTQDEKWVQKALDSFDESKVTHLEFEALKNQTSEI